MTRATEHFFAICGDQAKTKYERHESRGPVCAAAHATRFPSNEHCAQILHPIQILGPAQQRNETNRIFMARLA